MWTIDDRLTFISYINESKQIASLSNPEEDDDNYEEPKTVQKTVSNPTYSNAWLTFMFNVAGMIHFYGTFREIAPNEMNIQKDDVLFVVNIALCDFFNAIGKLFWSFFSIYKEKG